MKITFKGINILPWIIPAVKLIRKMIRRKNMDEVNIKELADKVVADMKDAADIVEGVKVVKAAWASESNILKKAFAAVSAAAALITDVIGHVETLGKDLALASTQKKDLAVEIINRFIDIPYVPENMEGILIGFTIDAIVGAFNRKFGKTWLTKIA